MGTTITNAEINGGRFKGKFVTTTQGLSGHFAVVMWWNPEMGGFWEPWDTGFGRYATEAEAKDEAKMLSDMVGIPYQEG